tara:strand:+ start:286 stop:576 length:291 start_codon:yes stop_codon:yes gene_type:complete
MEQEVKALKDGGRTWKEVSAILDISVSSARRLYKKAPEYPKFHDGVIHRKVINPRMMLIKIGDKVVSAVIRPGNYRQGAKVKVEQVDERRYRVVRV